MTYQEAVNLKNQLLNNEISVADAKALYFADTGTGKKSWHTKDWKERRNKIIKDRCEICGSTETLTLQHRSHPKKYYEFEKEVATAYARLYIESNATVEQQELLAHVENNFDYYPVDLCPKCGRRHPNIRMRKTPQYLCTECRLEFDEAVHKTIQEIVAEYYSGIETAEVSDKCFVSKDKYRNQQNLPQIVYWLSRDKAKSKYKDEIEREAFLNYLQDNIKYLSFEDTMTCCKKCAFNFDLNNMELCPVCKKFYKGIQYPTCIQCLPEDKRKAALEKIEFGKAWQSMHEELGID
jgi:hypothetical protein